ncbi:MarR family winged helix-turn-helix transcriptional regulator [Cohnella sp. WQ 127256]|uniref:MarR family winged helix-turn-helix transcriptional regulator n=1 Tax=Cohnella sp. WQ 127256 TaxID=2938790 RepID=UPI0021182EF3|nr:MarR family transcriptional regulator [Cohnella sp. WQ 127256]
MSQSILYLKRTYIIMRKELDVRLSKFNLTTSQFEILGYLSQSGGLEQQKLQHHSGITSATLTGILDKLEDRSYISRKPSHTDGRANVVTLTKQGNEVFVKLVDLIHEFENEMLKGFTQAERDLLGQWLQRVAKNLGDKEFY